MSSERTFVEQKRSAKEYVILLYLLIVLLMSSCTVSMVLTDTHGYASDVVDDEQKQDVSPSTSVKVPLMGV